MRKVSGLTTVSGFETGWNDGDERYMNHLDDVYGGRIIDLYASATLRYKEKKDAGVRRIERHAADRLLIEIGKRGELARAKERDRGKR